MTLSEQLSKLADRAAEAEHRAAAAREKTRTDLEREVTAAREHTESLRASGEEKLTTVRRSWDEHVADVRSRLDARRAEHDAKQAAKRADEAEDYAELAADFAYSAVVDAEYAALDAALAHMDAGRLAQGLTEVAS